MGMMIVSDEEFDALVNKDDSVSKSKVTDIKVGRGKVKEVPLVIKKIISEASIQGAPPKEIQKLFPVSPSSISAYKNDATSTASYHTPDKELKKSNDIVRETISNSARSKLLDALENITADKLKEANLKTVASVAKDMSYIIKNMEVDDTLKGDTHNTQFVFYAPPIKTENEYESIPVNQ
jgi:DNA-directed RNA polymerase sigma subunit (sigma70/sigma32)